MNIISKELANNSYIALSLSKIENYTTDDRHGLCVWYNWPGRADKIYTYYIK